MLIIATGWTIGFWIGSIVVLAVVALVVPILLPTVEALSVHGLDRYDLMVWFGAILLSKKLGMVNLR